VPDRWFPQGTLDRESYAFGMLFGAKEEQSYPRKIGADAWFDRSEAEKFEIFEQTFPLPNNEILTLLTFTDEEMMTERDTSWSYRHKLRHDRE
jgi:hypothetical protein